MDNDDGVVSLAAALALLSNIDIRMRSQGLVFKIVIGGNYMYNERQGGTRYWHTIIGSYIYTVHNIIVVLTCYHNEFILFYIALQCTQH